MNPVFVMNRLEDLMDPRLSRENNIPYILYKLKSNQDRVLVMVENEADVA